MRSITDSLNINYDVVGHKYNIGGDDVASIEELETRSSTYPVN